MSASQKSTLLLKALAVAHNSSIRKTNSNADPLCVEIRDPFLAQVVRRVEAGDLTIDAMNNPEIQRLRYPGRPNPADDRTRQN